MFFFWNYLVFSTYIIYIVYMQWILDPDIKAHILIHHQSDWCGSQCNHSTDWKDDESFFQMGKWLQHAIRIFERNINYKPGLNQNITCLFLDGPQESVWDIQGKVLLSEIKINNMITAPWGQIFCLFLPSLFTAK